MQQPAFDLEERLIGFGVGIVRLADRLPKTYSGRHFAGQLTRSGTSPAFQYGEAQAAESRADFIHKMKVGLKELKETFVNLKMIRQLEWLKPEFLDGYIHEVQALIRIFVSSVNTARRGSTNN